jgi:hypothetical protein
MRPSVQLTLNPNERTALRSLTAEEREAVVDEMLRQVRDDLTWTLAREAVRESAPADPTPANQRLQAHR